MRIAVFTVDQVYSNLIIKGLINEFGGDIVLIVDSGVILYNKSLFQSLKRLIQVSGLYYCLVQAIRLEIYKIFSLIYSSIGSDKDNKFYEYHKLSRVNKIQVITVKNVNSPDFINILKKRHVDLIVSVLFNQIVKTELITIPSRGVINIHPAFLPEYKGVSPIFWALVNGEKYSGITVHSINEGIDTGKIIAREKVEITNKDTEDTLYWKTVKIGTQLLIKSIHDIELGRVKTIANQGGKYFSLPTKEAIKIFKFKKRHFFKLHDILFSN